jgi:hypothetical protein
LLKNNRLKKLTYSITILPKAGEFKIVLDFQTGKETSTVIQLPKEFGSFSHAYRFVAVQKGKNTERYSVDIMDSSVINIQHQPKQKVSFVYTVKNALAGIKAGDIIKGYCITYNPMQQGEITVERKNERIKIKFFPL